MQQGHDCNIPDGESPLFSVQCWVGVGLPSTEQGRVVLAKRMAVRGEEGIVTVGLTGGEGEGRREGGTRGEGENKSIMKTWCNVIFSPCTMTSCATTDSPYSLVATHSYTPASLEATGKISRSPVGFVLNLSEGSEVPSILRQLTVAMGKL